MIITCKNCNTSFNLSDELVKDTGSKVKCSKCNYIFTVFPPHIQNETDLQQNDLSLEFEEKISTKTYIPSDPQHAEEKGFFNEPDPDKDWDLSEIEKILQEKNGETYNGETLERDDHQEDYDDFEFGDLDDLFSKEDSLDDQTKETNSTTLDKEPDLHISSGETEVEEIDLSELNDFFKEDDDWVKNLSEIDTDSKVSNVEFDVEKKVTSDFLEPEPVEEVEDIDLSELDDLFRDDAKSSEDIELDLDASEKAAGTISDYSEKIEETEFEFDMAENRKEASFTEKDDYNPNIENEAIKPKSWFGKTVLVALVFILLAGAGYGVFTVFNVTGSQIPIIGSYLKTETPPDPGNLKLIALDLNSKFDENQHVGKIFIITGIIKNEYSEPRSFVKITGKLYEPAKKLALTEQVYAGNVFSELEFRSLDMEAIKIGLNNRFGQNELNVNIEPGQSVPFMIIFSKLPHQLEEFTVEIESSSPA